MPSSKPGHSPFMWPVFDQDCVMHTAFLRHNAARDLAYLSGRWLDQPV